MISIKYNYVSILDQAQTDILNTDNIQKMDIQFRKFPNCGIVFIFFFLQNIKFPYLEG
jgi:hypothetical protein